MTVASRKFGLCILALLALAAPAAAQDSFPSRPIKFVVPLAAGGGIDFTARVTAQKLSDVIGQQVVVENQGGAGGSIGVNQVVRATPDGYTLLYHSVTGIVNAAVAKDLPFDYLRDLVPVALVTRFAAVMVINPDGAGQGPQGVHRARQGQSRQIQLRLVRPGHRHPSRQRTVQAAPPASTSCTCRIAATPA